MDLDSILKKIKDEDAKKDCDKKYQMNASQYHLKK